MGTHPPAGSSTAPNLCPFRRRGGASERHTALRLHPSAPRSTVSQRRCRVKPFLEPELPPVATAGPFHLANMSDFGPAGLGTFHDYRKEKRVYFPLHNIELFLIDTMLKCTSTQIFPRCFVNCILFFCEVVNYIFEVVVLIFTLLLHLVFRNSLLKIAKLLLHRFLRTTRCKYFEK
jgi:hypothetical protein